MYVHNPQITVTAAYINSSVFTSRCLVMANNNVDSSASVLLFLQAGDCLAFNP
jgi:hypothetical protein